MPLSDYINLHAGETAWLFGKGQSFSQFDFKNAGKIRAAINDVIQYVPDCLYGFANDGVAKWSDVYKPHHTLFQPLRCLHEYDSTKPEAVNCKVVTFHDDSEDRRLLSSREEMAEVMAIRRGTLGSALQILHLMGIKTVHMVGFDGGGHHASGYEWRTRLRHDHAKDYDAIKFAAIDAARIMGMTLKFHNQENDMTNDGKVMVKFSRNCFVQSIPYRQGEIASINPRDARQLIVEHTCELFSYPEKQAIAIETAEAPQLEKESAIIKKVKKGRK